MAKVKVQKVTREDKGGPTRRKTYALVCYYYPQYKLEDVQALPARDVKLLLNTVKEQQAAYLHNLTLIAQAPHSEKQKNVKKLIEHFKKLAGA